MLRAVALISCVLGFAPTGALAAELPRGPLVAVASEHVTIHTRDGKTHLGRILRENQQGYLFQSDDGSTYLVEYSTIATIEGLGTAPAAVGATGSQAPSTSAPPLEQPPPPPPRAPPATPPPPPPPPAGKVAKTSGVDMRFGFGPAFPSGSVSGATGANMSDLFGTLWSIDLDLGYRFSTNWYLGIYVSGTPWDGQVGGQTKTACDAANGSCSAKDARFGLMGAYHFTPEASADLWLGLGLEYELATVELNSVQTQLSGSAFRTIIGVDWDWFGLFLELPLGVYRTIDVRGTSQSINQTAAHSWPRFGIEFRLY